MTNQNGIFRTTIATGVAVIAMCICASARAANVVPRGTSSSASARPTVTRTNQASARMPTLTANITRQDNTTTDTASDNDTATDNDATDTATTLPATDTTTPVVIMDKTSQFDAALGNANAGGADTSADERAEMIRRQRAALDAADATDASSSSVARATASGKMACDTDLRACMAEKCGSDFSKCSGDTDTLWGDKMDACRRKITTCTSAMYAKFAPEIRADRDMNARLASYNKIIDCGNRYNECIVEQCGVTYSKCLGKSAGDTAISACAQIARDCTTADNGLASRTMNVFATLRQGAEVQVKSDEQRLYALRDQMSTMCRRLGAMFDERSLTCVYTVNFWAGENQETPYASKKAYAGSSFDCTQNWFGIDVTTFKENAYRLTREQTSATSSLMGSGVGMAVGAVTSGAINRAIDRHKADRALKQAEDEHQKNYGDDESDKKDNATEATEEQDKEKQTPDATPTENPSKTGSTQTDGPDKQGNDNNNADGPDASNDDNNGGSDGDTPGSNNSESDE